jgi:hypothetical protein
MLQPSTPLRKRTRPHAVYPDPIPGRFYDELDAWVAFNDAVQRILYVGHGNQASTLRSQSIRIGRWVAADRLPLVVAKPTLIWAAKQLVNFDRSWPWKRADIEALVTCGLRHGGVP